ncbi:MAG: RNA polymerase sigma factor [Planctomycetaceae bacterium]|nr:RNA polymerase sigma factor [Planctomycetaceae bacterium]
MLETSLSLLDRLRTSPDDADWSRLVEAYAPLMRAWLMRSEVQAADADDLVQEVLLVVHRELPSFQHNQRCGAFRSWLRQIVVHRLRNFWRSRGRLAAVGNDSRLEEQLRQLEDDGSHFSQLWDREHSLAVARKLLELVESRFTETTRLVFRRLVLDGADADTVASETGLSLNAIFTAKSRVLRELRRLGAGLLD